MDNGGSLQVTDDGSGEELHPQVIRAVMASGASTNRVHELRAIHKLCGKTVDSGY